MNARVGAVPDPQQQLGRAKVAPTRIYASALSGTRRAMVMALEFEVVWGRRTTSRSRRVGPGREG